MEQKERDAVALDWAIEHAARSPKVEDGFLSRIVRTLIWRGVADSDTARALCDTAYTEEAADEIARIRGVSRRAQPPITPN